MLDIDKIQALVDMMVAHDLVEISLRDGDVEVSLRRPSGNPSHSEAVAVRPPVQAAPNIAAGPQAPVNVPAADAEDADLAEIKSPMVGTFYATPDPDSPPFVEVGTQVHPSTVVCVVEAMKVFNEIKAEITGTIERVLVKSEQPVEYGQPLFLVRPL